MADSYDPQLIATMVGIAKKHGGGGGGASSLAQLSDVDIGNLEDGDALVYSDNDDKWKNKKVAVSTFLDDTLDAGDTTIIFSDPAIRDGSFIYVSVEGGIWYSNLVTDTTNHTCTLTFTAQQNDLDIVLEIKER